MRKGFCFLLLLTWCGPAISQPMPPSRSCVLTSDWRKQSQDETLDAVGRYQQCLVVARLTDDCANELKAVRTAGDRLTDRASEVRIGCAGD
jgi:hypothetical protein